MRVSHQEKIHVESLLNKQPLPAFNSERDINLTTRNFAETLYDVLSPLRQLGSAPYEVDSETCKNRCITLLKNNDHKGIWKAFNWKGEISRN